MWSLGGTSLILGYMLLVGVFKMMEGSSSTASSSTASTKEDETTGLLKNMEEQAPQPHNYQTMTQEEKE
jgi:hypothetical protein